MWNENIWNCGGRMLLPPDYRSRRALAKLSSEKQTFITIKSLRTLM
jgi:hypothetical protein